MKLTDWREASYATLAPIYESERQQWLRQLQWDPAPAWNEVERARTTWGLPGLLATDDAGRIRGTVFYMQEDDRIDIGGLTSDHVDATDALIDGVLTAAAASSAREVRAMLLDRAVALRSGLAHRGFAIEAHLYLSRSFGATPSSGTDAPRGRASRGTSHAASSAALLSQPRSHELVLATDAWRESDVEAAAALFRRAYEPDAGSLFAPGNHPAEWERYVRNLIAHPACGTVNIAASCVVRHGDGLGAVALVTDVSSRTAHLVQLAVDPAMRGQGVGGALVGRTCAHLAERGYGALTLLVAQGNARARALYDGAGFRHDATFLAATRQLVPGHTYRSHGTHL
jgi:ribosomal protein S18 acetylase RimI-like enzyme